MPEIVLPLTVCDLTAADLPSCAWPGGPAHLAAITEALDCAARGEADHLAACPPSGLPVALGGIDYAKISGAGMLWQFAVRRPVRDRLHADAPGLALRDGELHQVASSEASAW